MAWFYEIRSADNAVLKRDGGFATVRDVTVNVEAAGANASSSALVR